MVKKVLVKPNVNIQKDAVFKQPDSSKKWLSYEVVDAPYHEEVNYVIDFAEAHNSLEEVVESEDRGNDIFEIEESADAYEATDASTLTPEVVLTEGDVEVAAYATLSADSHSAKNVTSVSGVILQPNVCPLHCGESVKSENQLRRHLKDKHSIQMQKEVKQFANMGSFLTWKEGREREACRRYAVRETRDDWRRFACSRSGLPSGTDRPQRWKRTGNFCPAYIRTKTAPDGSVKARFCLLHTCQQPDNTRLPSEREVDIAHRQLGLLERALSECHPRPPTRRRSQMEPRSESDDQPEKEPEVEPHRRPQEERLSGPEEAEPVRKVGRKLPPTSEARRRRSLALSGQYGPTHSAASRAAAGDSGATCDVKALVKTNLLRLNAKLELATPAEAEHMLLETSVLLERHTRIRRRGRIGGRRRLQQAQAAADHQYAGGAQAEAQSEAQAEAAGCADGGWQEAVASLADLGGEQQPTPAHSPVDLELV